eukprot:3022605-Rhodomonas_salina.2
MSGTDEAYGATSDPADIRPSILHGSDDEIPSKVGSYLWWLRCYIWCRWGKVLSFMGPMRPFMRVTLPIVGSMVDALVYGESAAVYGGTAPVDAGGAIVWICGDGAAVYGGEADENGGQEASYSDEFERLHARSLVAAYARTTRCPVTDYVNEPMAIGPWYMKEVMYGDEEVDRDVLDHSSDWDNCDKDVVARSSEQSSDQDD